MTNTAEKDALAIACPFCGASAGSPCINQGTGYRMGRVHAPRIRVTAPALDDFQRATVEAFASMTPEERRAAVVTPRRRETRILPPGNGDIA